MNKTLENWINVQPFRNCRIACKTLAQQFLTIFSILLLVTGCASIGPRQIDLDRGRYNDVVYETDNAQMLKNIVRIRYFEPISFLKVTNVTASYALTNTVAVSQANPNWSYDHARNVTTASDGTKTMNSLRDTMWSFGLAPAVTYLDAPTLSYVPINDSDLVTALLKPLNLEQISLLYSGGFHSHTLLARLLFDSMNGLDNASFSTNPNSKLVSYDYEKYLWVINTLEKMHLAEKIDIVPIKYDTKLGIMIRFKEDHDSEEAHKIKEMMNVPQSVHDIVLMNPGGVTPAIKKEGVLTLDTSKDAMNVVHVKFRSVIGIMSFLSHAVEVPEEDLKLHYAKLTTDANGNYFDWSPLMDGVLKIYSSKQEPREAFVKTKFNKNWFYIKSSDHNSKVTFAVLVSLMTLTSGLNEQPKQTSPLLTLPVR